MFIFLQCQSPKSTCCSNSTLFKLIVCHNESKKERKVFTLLMVNNVEKYYGKKTALSNVTLDIPKGICYGLVGPNGAGKSTLMKIIASVIQDYKGTIQFTNEKIRVGYVPQDIALEETLSARDNLYFFGELYGLKGKTLKKRTNEVLTEIGLKERGKDKVQSFSGGMKRRLNIGCGIMHKPNLIIMDEPTVGVDPQSRRYIFQMIERMKEAGSTIIYASHYMEEIENVCEVAGFMDHGRIVENDHIDTILKKHVTPSVYVKGNNCLPEDISKYGSVQSKEDGYLVSSDNPILVMEKVLAFIKKNNTELERLELVKPRLEDVFFSLTGSKLRD